MHKEKLLGEKGRGIIILVPLTFSSPEWRRRRRRTRGRRRRGFKREMKKSYVNMPSQIFT